MSDRRKSIRFYDLVKDEKGALSSARCGMWLTMLLAIIAGGVDIHLVLQGSTVSVPNAIYATLSTMFMAFASWAAGPRIAQYIGPQLGQIAQGIGVSNRDKPPFPEMDRDESGG